MRLRYNSNGPRKAASPLRSMASLLAVMIVAVAMARWSYKSACPASGIGPGDNPRRYLTADLNESPGISGLSSTSGGEARVSPTAIRSSWGLAAQEAATSLPPKYSTHTCINQKFDDKWQLASCKFENMCLNTSTLKFEYYVSPEYPDNPVAYDQAGVPYRDFSEHLLHPGHWMEDKELRWRPAVKRQPFPQEGPRVKWAPAPQALLHAFPVRFVYNFGHAIFDVIVPLFNLQYLFGLYTPQAQVLILYAQGGTKKQLSNRMHAQFSPFDPELSLLRLTYDHDAAFLKNYTHRMLGDYRDGLVCFKTVLAGTGHLSRRLSRLEALPYRQAVVEHIGLREVPHDVPTITMFRKEGRRMIENQDEIFQLLLARYPMARMSMFDFGKRPNITAAEQVKLMSETSILISPCGGIGTVLMFLQPGSSAIVMNFWNTLKNRSMNMEDSYYRNLEYLDIQYFPVTPEEYTGTTDRPSCELSLDSDGGWEEGQNLERGKVTGTLTNCNLRIQGEGLQRLVHYVDNAMLRWAAQHGRYDVVEAIRNLPAGGQLQADVGGSAQAPANSGIGDGIAPAVAQAAEARRQ